MGLTLESTVQLRGGKSLPQLGFGTYKIEEGEEVSSAVKAALATGYRLIDTASFYGNEEGIGKAIWASGVPRKDIFVTTKVWNDEQGYKRTMRALQNSIRRLDIGYVDLLLIHWPIQETMASTWRAMERLITEGKTRAIGVANFLPHHMDYLLQTAEFIPYVDQVEFHPWLQQPELQEYLAEKGIALEAWAPLMQGRVDECEELVSIAEKHGVTPAQVSLRWILQLGHIAIPKSVTPERIAENADVFGFELDEEDMALIAEADRGERFGPDPDLFGGDWTEYKKELAGEDEGEDEDEAVDGEAAADGEAAGDGGKAAEDDDADGDDAAAGDSAAGDGGKAAEGGDDGDADDGGTAAGDTAADDAEDEREEAKPWYPFM